MSEIARERPDQNIIDLLELAFRDTDFEPISSPDNSEPNNSGLHIASGSVRFKYGYDFEAQSVVHVVESYSIVEFDPEDGPVDDHRLIIWWEGDRTAVEFDLDTREIIINDDEEITEEETVVSKRRLMQALKAVMPDIY